MCIRKLLIWHQIFFRTVIHISDQKLLLNIKKVISPKNHLHSHVFSDSPEHFSTLDYTYFAFYCLYCYFTVIAALFEITFTLKC